MLGTGSPATGRATGHQQAYGWRLLGLRGGFQGFAWEEVKDRKRFFLVILLFNFNIYISRSYYTRVLCSIH